MLSRSSEYAIRALAMLALQEDLKSLQAREIATELGLPPDFLTKILRRLTATDLVLSQRGRTGGFRLGRAPETISLLDIVAPFEDHETGIQCLLGQAFCTDHDACPLHREWVDIRVRFLDLLERTALADVAERAVRGEFPPADHTPPMDRARRSETVHLDPRRPEPVTPAARAGSVPEEPA